MGQCYSVILKIKVNDEQGAKRALKEKIENDKDRVQYNVEDFKKEGVDTDSLAGLIRVFLAGWKGNNFEIKSQRKFTCFSNDFNACYGWESVMLEMFEALAPYLADRSWIKVWPDSGLDYGIIRDHKVDWKS